MALPKDRLKTRTMTSKGQLTMSVEARNRFHLREGSNLIEIILDNGVLYVPQDEIIEGIAKRAKKTAERYGLTAEDLQASLSEDREKQFKEVYPELVDDENSA